MTNRIISSTWICIYNCMYVYIYDIQISINSVLNNDKQPIKQLYISHICTITGQNCGIVQWVDLQLICPTVQMPPKWWINLEAQGPLRETLKTLCTSSIHSWLGIHSNPSSQVPCSNQRWHCNIVYLCIYYVHTLYIYYTYPHTHVYVYTHPCIDDSPIKDSDLLASHVFLPADTTFHGPTGSPG